MQWALGVMVVGMCWGCTPCERTACEALSHRANAHGDESRVAGIVASESDAVANDCAECSFAGSQQVYAWLLDMPVTTNAEVRNITTASPPVATTTSAADGKYALPLDPGPYVVCVQISCFNATAVANQTTTLNLRLINGIGSAFLGLPGTSSLTTEGGFELPLEAVPRQ
jgi:hypothetical protein